MTFSKNKKAINKPVFLIGYMGAGKTTLGRAVARMAKCEFVDLDDAIVAEAGMSVREIFEREGEASFRAREAEMLRRMARPDVIVGCGGGTPCRPEAMRFMNDCGLTVWLTAPIERLVERLSIARDHRPLIARLNDDELRDFVSRNLAERTPHYSKARVLFDASQLETEEQIEASARAFLVAIGTQANCDK